MQVERLGNAYRLRLDKRRFRVGYLLSPRHSLDIRDVLFLVRAVQQTYSNRLAGIGFQNGRARVAELKRTENMRGGVLDFQPLAHRFAAVVYPHNAGGVVGTRMLGRIERVAVLVEQQRKIVQKQRKLAERLSVRCSDNRVTTPRTIVISAVLQGVLEVDQEKLKLIGLQAAHLFFILLQKFEL